jgi:hypothetical protein
MMYVAVGLFFGPGFQSAIQIFPLPVLGVLLFFEAVTLLVLLRDLAGQPADFLLALMVGVIAGSVPYGYLVGLVTGLLCYHWMRRGWVRWGA